MLFKSKVKKQARDVGAEVGAAILDLIEAFYDVRVTPLQEALIERFGAQMDNALASSGLSAEVIRKQFAGLENAWLAELLDMKPELLEFRDMQEWLECADTVGARDDILDILDGKFDGYTQRLRTAAILTVGGRVLGFGL